MIDPPEWGDKLRGRRYNRAKKAQGGTGANQYKQKDQNDTSANTAKRLAKEHFDNIVKRCTEFHRRQRPKPEGGGGIMKDFLEEQRREQKIMDEMLEAQRRRQKIMMEKLVKMKEADSEINRMTDKLGFPKPMRKPQTAKEKALKSGFAVIRGGALQ